MKIYKVKDYKIYYFEYNNRLYGTNDYEIIQNDYEIIQSAYGSIDDLTRFTGRKMIEAPRLDIILNGIYFKIYKFIEGIKWNLLVFMLRIV